MNNILTSTRKRTLRFPFLNINIIDINKFNWFLNEEFNSITYSKVFDLWLLLEEFNERREEVCPLHMSGSHTQRINISTCMIKQELKLLNQGLITFYSIDLYLQDSFRRKILEVYAFSRKICSSLKDLVPQHGISE